MEVTEVDEQHQVQQVAKSHVHSQAPVDRVIYVAWSQLHACKAISIPAGSSIYVHELREAIYAALFKFDGRSIISRDEFNKQILVGMYYMHDGRSRLVPLSVLAQRLDFFNNRRVYLTDPDTVVHDWSISFVRSAVFSLLVLLLLLTFVKGPALGTLVFLVVVVSMLVGCLALWLLYTLLVPSGVREVIKDKVLNSVVIETLVSSAAAQLLFMLILAGVAYSLPQTQGLAHAAVERANELYDSWTSQLASLRSQTMLTLVMLSNQTDNVCAYLFEHGWLGLPLQSAPQEERRYYTHVCSRLFSNGVSFWESNYDMCEKLLHKRIRAGALQMKKTMILMLLCAGFISVLNRLTYVPSIERRGGFSWVTLLEWLLVILFAMMVVYVPFDSFDLSQALPYF